MNIFIDGIDYTNRLQEQENSYISFGITSYGEKPKSVLTVLLCDADGEVALYLKDHPTAQILIVDSGFAIPAFLKDFAEIKPGNIELKLRPIFPSAKKAGDLLYPGVYAVKDFVEKLLGGTADTLNISDILYDVNSDWGGNMPKYLPVEIGDYTESGTADAPYFTNALEYDEWYAFAYKHGVFVFDKLDNDKVYHYEDDGYEFKLIGTRNSNPVVALFDGVSSIKIAEYDFSSGTLNVFDSITKVRIPDDNGDTSKYSTAEGDLRMAFNTLVQSPVAFGDIPGFGDIYEYAYVSATKDSQNRMRFGIVCGDGYGDWDWVHNFQYGFYVNGADNFIPDVAVIVKNNDTLKVNIVVGSSSARKYLAVSLEDDGNGGRDAYSGVLVKNSFPMKYTLNSYNWMGVLILDNNTPKVANPFNGQILWDSGIKMQSDYIFPLGWHDFGADKIIVNYHSPYYAGSDVRRVTVCFKDGYSSVYSKSYITGEEELPHQDFKKGFAVLFMEDFSSSNFRGVFFAGEKVLPVKAEITGEHGSYFYPYVIVEDEALNKDALELLWDVCSLFGVFPYYTYSGNQLVLQLGSAYYGGTQLTLRSAEYVVEEVKEVFTEDSLIDKQPEYHTYGLNYAPYKYSKEDPTAEYLDGFNYCFLRSFWDGYISDSGKLFVRIKTNRMDIGLFQKTTLDLPNGLSGEVVVVSKEIKTDKAIYILLGKLTEGNVNIPSPPLPSLPDITLNTVETTPHFTRPNGYIALHVAGNNTGGIITKLKIRLVTLYEDQHWEDEWREIEVSLTGSFDYTHRHYCYYTDKIMWWVYFCNEGGCAVVKAQGEYRGDSSPGFNLVYAKSGKVVASGVGFMTGTLNANPSMCDADGDGLPDGWEVEEGVEVSLISDNLSGEYAVKLYLDNSGGSNDLSKGIYSEYIPYPDLYFPVIIEVIRNAAQQHGGFGLWLMAYDSDKKELSNNPVLNPYSPYQDTFSFKRRYVDTNHDWYMDRAGVRTLPEGTRFIRLYLVVVASAGDYAQIVIDWAGIRYGIQSPELLITDNISINNYRITELAAPTSDTDAVNKSYVDSRDPYAHEQTSRPTCDATNYGRMLIYDYVDGTTHHNQLLICKKTGDNTYAWVVLHDDTWTEGGAQ